MEPSSPERETKRLAIELPLRASPRRIFQSLLAPDDLFHWFCPRIGTDHIVGGQYVFFGDESIATIYSEGQGGGPIYGCEPGKSLWYVWQVAGVETDVVFYIKTSEDGTTRLQLVHQGLETGLMLMDFWHLRLYALRAYLEGREAPPFYNYGPRAIPNIHQEVLIKAAPEAVFDALIQGSKVSRWMNAEANIDAKLGGLYDLGWRDAKGFMAGPQEILALDPGRVLAYRWQFGDEVGVGPEVHITLVEEDEGTQVLLDHEGFSTERDNRDYDQGWLQLLFSLKTFVEEGAMPMTVLEGSWDL